MGSRLGYAVVSREQLIKHCEKKIADIADRRVKADAEFLEKELLRAINTYNRYWWWTRWFGGSPPTLESVTAAIDADWRRSWERSIHAGRWADTEDICYAAMHAARRLRSDTIEVALEVLNACGFVERNYD